MSTEGGSTSCWESNGPSPRSSRCAYMRPLCRRTRPSGDSDAHEAKFPRLEEAGQAALEVAQEEDAPPKTRPEDAQGVSPASVPPGPPCKGLPFPVSPHPFLVGASTPSRAEMTRRGSAEPCGRDEDPDNRSAWPSSPRTDGIGPRLPHHCPVPAGSGHGARGVQGGAAPPASWQTPKRVVRARAERVCVTTRFGSGGYAI